MEHADKVSTVCVECGASIAFELGATQVRCTFCDGGMAVGDGTRLVRLSCPACAGNFYYIDGLMGGQCPYCQTALLALTRHRVLRFVVRPRVEAPADDAVLCLAPFWQLTGVVYGWDMGSRVQIDHNPSGPPSQADGNDPLPTVSRNESGPMKKFRGRVVERWLPDPSTRVLGITSLRLRAAVFPIEPFVAEHEDLGRMLPATLDIPHARDALYSVAMSLGHASDGLTKLDCQRSDLVADALSLLYYPFWVRKKDDGFEVWDGVSGIAEPLGKANAVTPGSETPVFDDLSVIELRCGKCGHELLAGNHAVVYPCRQCATFWVADKDGLKPFAASYARPWAELEGGDKLAWLPFWQVAATVEYCGNQASRAPDARNVLGIMRPPGKAPSADARAPMSYFVPAYGAMRAPKLDVAARDMTRLQPSLTPGEYASGEVFSCFFGPEDAEKLAYVVWLQVLPGANWRRLRSLRVQADEIHLWYIPFAERPRELVNLLTGARYDRMAFRGLGH